MEHRGVVILDNYIYEDYNRSITYYFMGIALYNTTRDFKTNPDNIIKIESNKPRKIGL